MRRLLFVILIISAQQAYSAGCGTDETVVSSCTLLGKTPRVAAFCAKENSTIYYSFEKNKKTKLRVDFNSTRKLKRWVDKWTYTTYFGFSEGKYDYILGVPEEKPNAVAFLNIKKDGKSISTSNCSSNLFGEKDIKNINIEDVSDSSVRDNGFKFP